MAEERVVVIGGCGFVGYHIVKAFLEDATNYSINVISRDPSRNRLQGVEYQSGNITPNHDIRLLLEKIQPTLIIHCASPFGSGNTASERDYWKVNVNGTQNLLDAAIAIQSIKVFIFTSSADVIGGMSQNFATEEAPLLSPSSRFEYYAITKAVAEKAVQDANGINGLRTLSLRPVAVYGELDGQMIPPALEMLQENRHHYQIGSNEALFDFVSATNVARCHLSAAKILLNGVDAVVPKVDGEAFFITDGKPIPFWTFMRKIWAAAGCKTKPEDATVIPAWLMLNLASVVEWLYWALSMGAKRPKMMRRQAMAYTCLPRTYSIAKAKDRLKYTPVDDRDDQIQKGVEWAMRTCAEAPSKRSESGSH